uniref:Neuropeptide-like 4 n=2 Tax=Panagrellus redivivus TaxID=6233 RepID=A0A7E4VSC6_PANRE
MSAKLVLICLMAALIAFTAIDAQYAYEAAYPAYGYNYGTYGAAYGYPYSSYA